MSEFLFQYNPVHPTTWAYLSSLLMIGLFVKFGRFWSVRNLDLALLIALAPGLLCVHFGDERLKEEQALIDADAEVVPVTNGGRLDDAGTHVADPGPSAAASVVNPDNLIAVGPSSEAVEESAEPLDAGLLGDAEADPGVAAERLLSGKRLKAFGFIWLLSVSGLLLLRLLLDPAMVRRPLLEPNLSTGGLTFIGCFLFLFLMANVVGSPVTDKDLTGPRGADRLLAAVSEDESASERSSATAGDEETAEAAAQWNGPGNAVMYLLPNLVTMPQLWSDTVERSEGGYTRLAKAMAILSHLAVVIGIVAIGYRHFGNIQTGIGAATLYLMLPYTSQMTGRVDHVLPAALLVWAVLCYRRPLPAGMFIGLAIGVAYYPLFLLPLWVSFYWQRGLMRFFSGVFSMLLIVTLSMIFVSSDLAEFGSNVQRMFGLRMPVMENLGGLWGLGWQSEYRIPVLAAFVALSGTLAIWPIQKNLGTLLSCSAALMVATQFWHGDGGGLYMAWYVPLTLLTIFRPNLEDRVALTVLGAGWLPRRFKTGGKRIDIAA